MGVAADLADVVVRSRQATGVLQRLFVQLCMHAFHLIGKAEVLGNGVLAFVFGFLHHFWVHLGKFVRFTLNGGLEIGGGVADFVPAGLMQDIVRRIRKGE